MLGESLPGFQATEYGIWMTRQLRGPSCPRSWLRDRLLQPMLVLTSGVWRRPPLMDAFKRGVVGGEKKMREGWWGAVEWGGGGLSEGGTCARPLVRRKDNTLFALIVPLCAETSKMGLIVSYPPLTCNKVKNKRPPHLLMYLYLNGATKLQNLKFYQVS